MRRISPLLILSGCFGLEPLPAKDEPTDSGPINVGADSGLGDPLDDTGAGDNNIAPVADAGDDLAAEVGELVRLDGGDSYDPEEDTLTYAWTLMSSPSDSDAKLINSTWADPEIFIDKAGTYEVMLTVSDGALSDTDTVIITATRSNDAPTADAGADQTVYVGTSVTLNGTGSSDPENDPLSYSWRLVTKPSGSVASLSDPTAARPTMSADRAGSYALELTVSDGVEVSLPDQMTVTAIEDSGGGDSGGDICGCSDEVQRELMHRSGISGAAQRGVAMLGLPSLLLFLRRRRSNAEQRA
jgi:hypothetical protein